MRALLRAAEADAALDEWGVMRPAWNPLDAARNLFPRLYPRMIEIIQQIGASGLVAMPTEQDLEGPLADDIRQLLPGRARRRLRANSAVPARVGRRDLGVRRAPGALRALLLRRSGPHGRRARRRARRGDSRLRGARSRARPRLTRRSVRGLAACLTVRAEQTGPCLDIDRRCGLSYSALGAAAPPWPMNNDEPSGSVMSRPLARNVRSFAWNPST